MDGICIDGGEPTSGIRCRIHNGAWQAREAALALADSDRQLMAWAKDMSAERIATRLNVSRNRVYQKLRDARRREKLRTVA